MLKTRYIPSFMLGLLLLSLAGEQPLKAYADPGSGAMFVQIALAGIIGCLFRVRSVFNRFRRRKQGQETAEFFPKGGLTRSSK